MSNSEQLCEVTFCGGTAPYVPAVRETREYEAEDDRETVTPAAPSRGGGRIMVIGFGVVRI
jgi:hypothetical protein